MSAVIVTVVVLSLVGAIVGFSLREKSRDLGSKVFEALDRGGIAEARAVIDRAMPPAKPTGDRLAALALIGDREGLAREVATVQNGYVKAAGLLGLASLPEPSTRLAELAEVAARFDREASALAKLAKDGAQGLATFGVVLAGANAEALKPLRINQVALNQRWLMALLWHLSARAFARDGYADLATSARTMASPLADRAAA